MTYKKGSNRANNHTPKDRPHVERNQADSLGGDGRITANIQNHKHLGVEFGLKVVSRLTANLVEDILQSLFDSDEVDATD